MLSKNLTLNNCPLPLNCPAVKAVGTMYGIVIAQSSMMGILGYLTINADNDRQLFNAIGYELTPDVYTNPKILARLGWHWFGNILPNAIWCGFKAGAYTAVYPAITGYNWVHRQISAMMDIE